VGTHIGTEGKEGEFVGGAWLSLAYDVQPVQPLGHISRIGPTRFVHRESGRTERAFTESYRPKDTFVGHLEFMLKHERVHLEFLSRLFEKVGEKEIAHWVASEPTGRYARRSAWFFEWLTGKTLDVSDLPFAPYVFALEPDRYWTADEPVRNVRWHVRDNMPGTSDFCPMVSLTDEVRAASNPSAVVLAMDKLEEEFGEELLLRSAVWLTVKESRSSFKIEGEHEPRRAERLAIALERYMGKLADPLGAGLFFLQREVLGDRALHYGLRRSPVFVGEQVRLQEIVHYVGPHHESVASMLASLRETHKRTQRSQPVIAAAALSFAFVYLHPLSDGNGRISRFIVNDVLRRSGVVQPPFVLPVSAVIANDLAAYDRVLDLFSAPLRNRYARAWRFGRESTYADGLVSNFEFDEYADATHAWRFIDLSDHVLYLAGVIAKTVSEEMHMEADYIRRHRLARERLRELIEGGDNALDRIIRSVATNRRVTGAIEAEFPLLEDAALQGRVVEAVLTAFSEGSPAKSP
jgi:hypothetical protein